MSKNTVSNTISNFEEFQGLDFKKTPLTRKTNFAREFQNYRNSEGDSVRGTEGFRALAQPGILGGLHNYVKLNRETGATEEEVLGVNAFLWKLGKDRLTVAATPSTGTYTANISYTYDSGNVTGTLTLNVYSNGVLVTSFGLGSGEIETNAASDSHFRASDTAITEWCYTVWELASAIDATGAFSCTYPTESGRFANAMGSTFTTAITMDAGHTLTSQGISSFYSNTSKALFPFSCSTAVAGNTANINNGEYAFLEDYTLSSNIAINKYFGKGAAPAAGIEIVSNGTSGFYIDYYYWEPVRCGYEDSTTDVSGAFAMLGVPNRWRYPPFKAFFNSWKESSTNNSQLPVFKNSHDICLIGSYCPSNYLKDVNFGYIFKYDGTQVYRLGLPTPAYWDEATSTGVYYSLVAAGNLTGYYKYRIRFKHTDQQENVTYSRYIELTTPTALAAQNLAINMQGIVPEFSPLGVSYITSNAITTNSATVSTATTATSFSSGDTVGWYNASTNTINYAVVSGSSIGTALYLTEKISAPNATTFFRIRNAEQSESPEAAFFKNHFGFPCKSIISSGNTGNQVSTLTFSAGALHSFKAGDLVSILDYSTPNSGLTKYVKLSSVTTTAISWDATKYGTIKEIRNVVSNGLVIEVFRTKSLSSATTSGNFYKLWEVPYIQEPAAVAQIPDGAGAALQVLIDNRADTYLAEEFFDQEFGEEFDLPPRAHLLELHQGTLVGVGTKEPNTARWSLPGEHSYFPLATRSVDIDSSISSEITAIISSDDSKLIAFKDRGHYELDGDFTTVGAVSSRIISENDYGVSSQRGLIRAKNSIIGIGKNGILSISNGVVNLDFAENINPVFQNNSGINFKKASVYINQANQELGFFLPGVTIPTTSATTLANWIVFDYSGSTPRWYTRVFGKTNSGSEEDMMVMYNPLGGACFYQENFFFFSDNAYSPGRFGGQLYKQFPRFTSSSAIPTYTPGLYLAQSKPITNIFSPQWEASGNPSLYKMFRRLRIWSFPSEVEERTAFDITVKGYRNWSSTVVENKDLSFTTSDFWKTFHLKTDSKLLSFTFGVESTDITGTQAPFISGYQHVALAISSEEDILL